MPLPFFVALSFLTRLGHPHNLDDAAMGRASLWFAPVGLILGALCTLTVWMLVQCAPLRLWAAAWIYVVLGLWLTRGLHWDGLADLGDAWGSGARGEAFWHILRDSRLGAFGAMTLFAGLSGMLLVVHDRLAEQTWVALVLAPAFGRVCAVLLAAWTQPRDPASLGGKMCAGISAQLAWGYAMLAAFLALTALPWYHALAVLVGMTVMLAALRGLALRQGGVNGDFMGAAIVAGELVYLL